MRHTFKSDDDLRQYMTDNLIGTGEASEILNCTRQNIGDLIRRGKLTPVVVLARERLFWKSDILARVKPSE